jgi:hypothetical protein
VTLLSAFLKVEDVPLPPEPTTTFPEGSAETSMEFKQLPPPPPPPAPADPTLPPALPFPPGPMTRIRMCVIPDGRVHVPLALKTWNDVGTAVLAFQNAPRLKNPDAKA